MKGVENPNYDAMLICEATFTKYWKFLRIYGTMISITSGSLPYLHFKHLKEIKRRTRYSGM
jgi:hypothetical protein